MPSPIDSLFNSQNPDLQSKGSKSWNQEIFQRAYCRGNGIFDKVCQRLRRGFSVLVYLPGNCMVAAAEVAKRELGPQAQDWTELGKPDEQVQKIKEIWEKSTSMFTRIQAWFASAQNKPHVIFHNLDLLSDGHRGLDPTDEAKTALFYLVDSVRSGVVLGLSDRDAGELPAIISRAFDEVVWLDELPTRRFSAIIPRKLGEKLEEDGMLPDGAIWLLASRLRWIDPIRAVNIMDFVADHVGKGELNQILQKIMDITQTVEFLTPAEIENIEMDPESGDPTGFEGETIRLLKENVIVPFRNWASFKGEPEECQRELRKLPPGLILYGPPGTGKTRLARWVAKSINLPVRLVSAADLKRADWGLTEQLIKDLFRSARRAAPCVVVLDDADDLLPDRASAQGPIGSAERGIVNAFLQELEGWHGRLEGVLVILTTNRYKELDAAAKQRLHLHLRIPYPLNEFQVSQIVSSVATSYNLYLSDDVRKSLVESFMRPLIHTSASIETEAQRRAANNNLFSPREISAAMRLLVGSAGAGPDSEDVKRMLKYLERQEQDVVS